MKKATKIRDLDGFVGSAALYETEPGGPLPRFVVVSAVDLPPIVRSVPGYRTSETMIFEASADGGVIDWEQLAMVDHKSHAAALAQCGYEVA